MLIFIITFQILSLFFVIFYEKDNLFKMLIWALVTLLIPIFGLLIYLVFGNNLKIYSKNLINNKSISTINYLKMTNWYKQLTKEQKLKLFVNKQNINYFVNISSKTDNNININNIGNNFVDNINSSNNCNNIKNNNNINNDNINKNYYDNCKSNNYNNFLETKLTKEQILIANYAQKISNSPITYNNHIKTFYNGPDFFNDLILEISKAKHNINLQFFIFKDDKFGKILASKLIEKSKQGVKIQILYDGIGSRKTKLKFWKKLKNNNIIVQSFFPSPLNLSCFNIRLNYRNHRKIVIIDGRIGYIGGVNIRADHMNAKKSISPWRDTTVKIAGNGVYSLQSTFLNDLSASDNVIPIKTQSVDNYFPLLNYNKNLNTILQMINSGSNKDQFDILNIYKKIILQAKKFIIIQTPYFIIDDELINLLLKAHNKNIDITIFIPKKPDKKTVYIATILCLQKLIQNNIKVYMYNGFIHSKVLLTEDVLSIGSCNFDNRSFKINFESTLLIYNKKHINSHLIQIQQDIKNSTLLDLKKYKKIKNKNIFIVGIYKIVSKFL